MTMFQGIVSTFMFVALPGSALSLGMESAREVAILKEFFESTGGTNWKENSGWLVTESPCDWYGVRCEFDYVDGETVSRIVSISLMDNNLTGTLPASMASLPDLRSLNVALNRLEGVVPPELLARWDDHAFQFYGAKNSFRNMNKKVRVRFSASGVLCSENEDLRYVFELEEFGPSRFESIRCVPNTERETHCLIKEGDGPYLERLSRALDVLGFRDFEPEYSYAFGFTTHQTFVTTTVWWGDGTEKTVETYGRQGPIEVWMAQQLFLGLLHSIYWESQHFESECPSQLTK